MGTSIDIPIVTVVQGTPIYITDYYKFADGSIPQLSDITGLDVHVFDMASGSEVYVITGIQPLAIGAGGNYSVIAIGPDGYSDTQYTFRYRLSGGAWSQQGGHSYRIELITNTVGGDPFQTLVTMNVISKYSG